MVGDRLLTVKDAAREYFQGKVSPREIYVLYGRGELRGFRVGGKILLYQSSLDAYRRAHENGGPPARAVPPPPPAPEPRRPKGLPPIRLKRLPAD